MSKTRVLVFDDYGARILINPPNIDELRCKPNVLIDPPMHLVKGLSPHQWKKVGHEVHPKLINEIKVRETPKCLKSHRQPVSRLTILLMVIVAANIIITILTRH